MLSDAQDGSEHADFGDNATRSIVYVDARAAAVTRTWSPTRASFKFVNGQMWLWQAWPYTYVVPLRQQRSYE